MKRREFIVGLAGALALMGSHGTGAQQGERVKRPIWKELQSELAEHDVKTVWIERQFRATFDPFNSRRLCPSYSKHGRVQVYSDYTPHMSALRCQPRHDAGTAGDVEYAFPLP